MNRSKNIWGRILDLAWLKFAMATLLMPMFRWPFIKIVQNWIVDRSTARDFTILDRYQYGAKAGVWNSSLASVHSICYDFHGNFNFLPYLPIAVIKTCGMLTQKEGLQRTLSCSNALGEGIKPERTMCIMCSKKVTSKSLLSSLYTQVVVYKTFTH